MYRTHLSAAFVVVLLAVAALPWGSIARGEPNADTPKAAAEQFLEALKKKDRKAYSAVVVSGDLAKHLFDFAVAAERFKEKMIKAYGEVGWRNFQDSEGANIKLSYNEMKLDQIEFEVEGDTAKGRTSKDDNEPLHMVRQNGRWQVDLDASFTSGTPKGMTAESFAKAMGQMAKIIGEYEDKIGDDTSVDELDKEMGAAFLGALMSAGAKPTVTVEVK